ncbi:uncharacterized protein LOC114545080 [Dendronephthya gigantea]|uniref:uncharacterized protein LOC114540414 n=1 Tax=Dendronephthya gigantea TaxID=151771 RepID=UPI00106AE88A|nr:uncharacterized protein LOC114540414 [Dendronephthya gigantea]XP_028417778.1 uncharacterized protein LOC114542423 [Dendronephthya gigantea]XP_028418313.1 uncharacterized protein LOC114543589 [Dendronephthya gigantea]XP_028418314.1 uncharacterized protein LOC114543589 [Dendronephthya gigantea]XP_028419200.1 uncharacterized protein LOC114544915 [Dendronephthya gigantea]XP_028419201.1 uncharacterized protein LOC114544915 [Dendronephthya gigantea]XP_028419202.1 uncharacterized protein LOC11454
MFNSKRMTVGRGSNWMFGQPAKQLVATKETYKGLPVELQNLHVIKKHQMFVGILKSSKLFVQKQEQRELLDKNGDCNRVLVYGTDLRHKKLFLLSHDEKTNLQRQWKDFMKTFATQRTRVLFLVVC